MFIDQAFDRLRQLYADQFESSGDGFFYRKNLKEAPILVSAAEHARYIAAYDKFIKYGPRSIIAGILAVTIGTVAYATAMNTDIPDIALYAGIIIVMIVFVAANQWARNLPARELRGRGTEGKARSRAEVRREYLRKTTYSQIAATVGAILFALFALNAREDLMSGWNRLWIAFGAITIALAGVQAFRKWRLEQADKR